MILVNCDIGERGSDNETDIELMSYIDIANIACGGHAGEKKSVGKFRKLALENDVKITAHLSYPDKENFGRVSMKISNDALMKSLSNQIEHLPDTKSVKLHGALYNDCWHNEQLSEFITNWFINHKIEEVIAPDNSVLAKYCRQNNIKILSEAFAERRYNINSKIDQLSLVRRSHTKASIDNCSDALRQAKEINSGQVSAFIDETDQTKTVPIHAETICIHSDSTIALQLARELQNV